MAHVYFSRHIASFIRKIGDLFDPPSTDEIMRRRIDELTQAADRANYTAIEFQAEAEHNRALAQRLRKALDRTVSRFDPDKVILDGSGFTIHGYRTKWGGMDSDLSEGEQPVLYVDGGVSAAAQR